MRISDWSSEVCSSDLHLDIVGAGFDKVLQFEIVSRGKCIAYADNAVVYDQKTSYATQLVSQRARWINTWFKYFAFGFKLVGRGLRRFNWNQQVFGITLLRPPLFIFLLSSVAFTVFNIGSASCRDSVCQYV